MACKQCIAFLIAMLALAASADAARVLRGRQLRGRDWGDIGDPSGYSAYTAARSFDFNPKSSTRKSLTPEAAEATTNSNFNGVYRLPKNPDASLSFATVESDPTRVNPDRKKEMVRPRARSAIDLPRGPNLSSGAAQTPMLAMGSVSASQTYEGATSVAASDAVVVNGGKRATITANSMLTSDTRPLPRAAAGISFGPTGKTVGAKAMAGPADGDLVIAQADSAVSMAQASKSNYDQWQTSSYEAPGKKSKGGRKAAH